MSSTPFDLESVFEVDDYLYFYSASLTDERTDAEVAALVLLLQLENSSQRILDLACGYGRHANRLAALGHRLTGIELMSGFLALARRDAEARRVMVDYRQGDIRQLDFKDEFDRVMLLFTAFGYFDDAENLQVLRNVQRALKPGGLFLMDVPNRDTFLRHYQPSIVIERDGNLMIDRVTMDSLNGRMVNNRVVIRNGVRKDKPFSVRLYNPGELRAVLEQAGLEIVRLLGGWDASPVSIDSRRLVVIAKKPDLPAG